MIKRAESRYLLPGEKEKTVSATQFAVWILAIVFVLVWVVLGIRAVVLETIAKNDIGEFQHSSRAEGIVGVNTKYGLCRGCKKWIPRDEMLSINITIYDAENKEERVPIRLCPSCHKRKQEEFKKIRWDNILKTEVQIRIRADLAQKSNLEFDDSEAAMRTAGLIR